MKLSTYIICVILLICCEAKDKPVYENIPCNPQTISTLNIFKPCRQYIYKATYKDADLNLISDEYIRMIATGKNWEMQPEFQKELIIQYHYKEALIDQIADHNINKSYPKNEWIKKEVTGVIEDKYTVWMHPFRANQYMFTEVACFPTVQLPLETGKNWESNLNIYEGWGDWSNSKVKNKYEVLEFETVDTPFKKLNAWHIIGTSSAPFGVSTHHFWFNSEYGFVKMEIKNYEGQLLIFELESVTD